MRPWAPNFNNFTPMLNYKSPIKKYYLKQMIKIFTALTFYRILTRKVLQNEFQLPLNKYLDL